MTKPFFKPDLLQFLEECIKYIRARLKEGKHPTDALRLAQDDDPSQKILLFLENFMVQTLWNVFELTPKTLELAYSAVLVRLPEVSAATPPDDAGAAKVAAQVAMGRAMAAILKHWKVLAQVGYVDDKAVFRAIVKVQVPRLLSTTLAFAKIDDEVQIVERLELITLSWTEVFSAN